MEDASSSHIRGATTGRRFHGIMLVLSRKVGERILIGEHVTVTVVRISGGGVRIGIEAPADMAVIREELSDPCVDEPASRQRTKVRPK